MSSPTYKPCMTLSPRVSETYSHNCDGRRDSAGVSKSPSAVSWLSVHQRGDYPGWVWPKPLNKAGGAGFILIFLHFGSTVGWTENIWLAGFFCQHTDCHPIASVLHGLWGEIGRVSYGGPLGHVGLPPSCCFQDSLFVSVSQLFDYKVSIFGSFLTLLRVCGAS